tara:strand:+ start:199 stop:684 length:486 start_codon:yes stop_codon:yes gene_type:complete
MNYLKISIGIFLVLAASRFIPHPPNFTSLIALSFYVPALLGRRFIPSLIFSFLLTDLVIGFHNTLFFTWGSVLLIGIVSNIFKKNLGLRVTGAIVGALIFFIVTNFGVWANGLYGLTLNGLIACYIAALPFFGNTIISTLIFSALIELIYNYSILRTKKTY